MYCSIECEWLLLYCRKCAKINDSTVYQLNYTLKWHQQFSLMWQSIQLVMSLTFYHLVRCKSYIETVRISFSIQEDFWSTLTETRSTTGYTQSGGDLLSVWHSRSLYSVVVVIFRYALDNKTNITFSCRTFVAFKYFVSYKFEVCL